MRNISIFWKVRSFIKDGQEINQEHSAFHISNQFGLYTQFGIPIDNCIIPQTYTANLRYYQKINGLLRSQLNTHLKSDRLPNHLYINELGQEASVNISKIRKYPGNVVTLTVSLSNLEPTTSTLKLITAQYLHQIKALDHIVRWTIDMMAKGATKNIDNKPSYKSIPGVRLDNVCESDYLHQEFETKKAEYVGLLIRNVDYPVMDNSIPERIWNRSREYTAKTDRKIVLLSKQGLLYLAASPNGDNDILSQPPDFMRVLDLYEIGYLFDAYIERHISLMLQDESLATSLLYKIRPWIVAPDIVFSSYSYRNLWEGILDEFRLKSRFEYVESQVDLKQERRLRVETKFDGTDSDEGQTTFHAIRVILSNIDIEINLRNVLLSDLKQSESAYYSGAYKACIVMLGAILEGVMLGLITHPTILDMLINDPNPPKEISKLGTKNPKLVEHITDKFSFEDYKNVTLFMIPMLEKLKVEGIQHFRNAIHPWKAVQEPQIYGKFDRRRALVHLVALDILIDNINSYLNEITLMKGSYSSSNSPI